MYDNSFWASGSGSWGNITIGSGGGYGYPPVYGGYPGMPYPGVYPQPGVSGVFGLDSTIVLIGAVVAIMLLLK